jgi:hypothetical protein
MSGSRQKFMINLLLAALLIFVFVQYAMGYFLLEIEGASGKIVSDKKEAYVLQTKNQQLNNSRQQYADIEQGAQQVFATIVSKDKTVDFITEAERVADKSQVKLRMNTVNDTAAGKKDNAFISTSGFELTVGGSYAGVMDFLYGIENLKYETDIQKMTLSAGDFDQYNKDMIVMTFTLKLYQKNS